MPQAPLLCLVLARDGDDLAVFAAGATDDTEGRRAAEFPTAEDGHVGSSKEEDGDEVRVRALSALADTHSLCNYHTLLRVLDGLRLAADAHGT